MTKYLYWIIVLLLFSSCKEIVIDEFPDFYPVPTVNALLVEGEPLKVVVSLAEKLDSSELLNVNNAKIDLYVNDEYKESLNCNSIGEYVSKIIIEPEKNYSCIVNVPGFDAIECNQTIPDKPCIINIEHINIAGIFEEGESYPAVIIQFKNDINHNQFYDIEIWYEEVFVDTIEKRKIGIHSITDPLIQNEGLPIALFGNELINDSVYTLTLNYATNVSRKGKDGIWRTELNPLFVELRAVTEDYYRYKKQLYLYQEGLLADGVFTSMTNANVYSNITNGYGIFAAYSPMLYDTIIPNTEGYYD